jgi:chromosome segregation ATPase
MKKKSKNQWIQIAFVILSFSGVPVMAQATSPTTPPPVTTPAGENAPGPWAVAAIQLMIQKGLFIGYLDGSYDWTKPMTRQEAAVMIARFIEKYGLDKFNPEEIAVMQSAITELQKALLATEEKLQKQILELQRQIGGVQQLQADDSAQLEARVEKLEVEVARLLEIIDALKTSSSNADLTEALERVDALTARLEELEARQTALEGQIRDGQPQNTTPSNDRLNELELRQAKLEEQIQSARVENATTQNSRLNELELRQIELGEQIQAARVENATTQNARLNELELRQIELEAQIQALQPQNTAAQNARLNELEARQRELEAQMKTGQPQTTTPQTATPQTTQPQRQELGQIEAEIKRVSDQLRAAQDRIAALEKRVEQNAQENQALATRIAALEARGATGSTAGQTTTGQSGVNQSANNTQTVTIYLGNLGELQRQTTETLKNLQPEIDKLDARVTDLEKRLTVIETRLTEIETRLTALEKSIQEALKVAQEALKTAQDALKAAQEALQLARDTLKGLQRFDQLLPNRGAFYVGIVANRTFPIAGAQGRVIFGNDAILDNIGLRGNVEFSTISGTAPLNFSADLTSRFSFGASDGYVGVGLGVMFFDPLVLGFSELLVGMNYRIFYNIAVFVEGRLTSIFDANNTNLGAIDFGLQFRF